MEPNNHNNTNTTGVKSSGAVNATTTNNDHNPNDDVYIEQANLWAGRTVRINGVGGYIVIERRSHNTLVRTRHRYSWSQNTNTKLCIESVPDMPGVVTFRFEGTHLYLTNIMYGDRERQALATTLAAVPGILADNIGLMVDFTIGRPTDGTNFEGAGFNYSPMMAQRGPPNKLQMFQLEVPRNAPNYRGHQFGVKSLFGTYWRAQHWDSVVSQSPHVLGDETWYFYHPIQYEADTSSGSGSRSGSENESQDSDDDEEGSMGSL